MRYVLALALLAAGVPAQQVAANENLASVKGVVTNAVTGERLRKAYVRLHPASGSARPATTDEQGRFVFEDLKPGTYKLEAEHVGFLVSQLADTAGTSVELHLAAGETADVTLKLTPQGAISGRVLDADGDAWVHAGLEVYHSVFKKGKRRLERAGGSEIDDQGQFRVGQLAPGTYYLTAEPDIGWEQNNRSSSEGRLQATWYPDSIDAEGSTPVILSSGQELSGLQIRLRRSATYRIRGVVSGLETLPRLSGRFANRNVWASSALLGSASSHSTNLQPDGSFEIPGVPNGEYNIGVALGSQGSSPLVKVRVDDRDVNGVSLEIARAHALKGSIRFGGNEAGRVSGIYIALESLDSGAGSPYTATREDGGFDLPFVSPGRYRVYVPAVYSGQYYLKLVRYEGTESHSGIISLSDGEGPLELVLSARGARLVVNVKQEDAADQVSAGRVVLVPDTDSPEEREFGTRPAVRDQNGIFRLDNLAPGAYRVFAFENVPDGAWIDAEFWKEIRGKGAELSVGEGESKTADAPLVLRSEIAALLSRLGME